MRHRRVLLALGVALAVAVCLAPSALALGAKVRVEASSQRIAPVTAVTVGSAPTFSDSAGTVYVTKKANALAALAKAAAAREFTWEASYGGTFVNNIAGFTSLPDWSQGWVYAVNGAGYPVIDVSAIDFPLDGGDSVLWVQSPDATFSRGSRALVVRTDKVACTIGDPLTVTVVADDLGKVNTQADYDRYGLTDASLLETPDAFAPVTGATVHIGSATYSTGTDGTVTVAPLDPGTSRVWAEKEMDAGAWYARSEQHLVNSAAVLDLSGVSVAPARFLPGTQKPKVSFSLSRAAKVVVRVWNSRGKVVFSRTVARNEGAGSYTWSGRGSDGRYVARRATYTLKVRAVDTWRRTTAWTTLSLKTR